MDKTSAQDSWSAQTRDPLLEPNRGNNRNRIGAIVVWAQRRLRIPLNRHRGPLRRPPWRHAGGIHGLRGHRRRRHSRRRDLETWA
jgi:hypothetical protein